MLRTASRKLLLVTLATVTMGAGLAASSAQAHPFGWGWGYHHGYYGGVGLGLGLIDAAVGSNCYIERREFVGRHNRVYVRDVQVCD